MEKKNIVNISPKETYTNHAHSDIIILNQTPKENFKEFIALQSTHKKTQGLSQSSFQLFEHSENKINYVLTNFTYLPPITEEAKIYQDSILNEVVEDPTLTDYTSAYRRLNEERNRGWKLNPSDIADFYLLERFISLHESPQHYASDTQNLALLQAKDRVSEIGKRLLVALTHEQMDEYDRWTTMDTDALPDDLKTKIHNFYTERHPEEGIEPGHPSGTEQGLNYEYEMNYYLSEFKRKLDEHSSRNDVLEIFDDKDMFATALQILESQQTGRWQVMAIAMSALLDKNYPLGNFIRQSFTDNTKPEDVDEVEKNIEAHRETFLIDRLLNYVHNTGIMSARITNYFPRSASLLLAHGMPGHDRYLHYYSSFINGGNNILASQLRKTIAQDEDRDIVSDFTDVVQINRLPREYNYALLLEFDNPKLQDAIQKKTGEALTPTSLYTLLQRVSHHDGASRGRLHIT
jgi:hypothetical protein